MYPVVEFEKVQAGIEGSVERVVDASLLTSHVGGRGTFATPAMIGLMEWCSHRSVLPHLPEGYTTVGFEVCVRHLAPTEPGGRVTVTSKLTRVDGRKLFFDVDCREGEKLCGTGTHRRVIVPEFS
jgi:fluoroacetyl-CoA thioesterase